MKHEFPSDSDVSRCSKCFEVKPLDDFHRHKQTRNGRQSWCKTCQKSLVKGIQKTQPHLHRRYNRARYQKRAAWLREVKAVPCVDCGREFPAPAMDLHHTDPTKKDFSLGNIYGWSESRVHAELAKCIVLCACCHRLRHYPVHDDLHGGGASRSGISLGAL